MCGEKMTVVFTRSNPVNPDSRVEKEVNALLKEGFEVIILAWDRDRKYDIEEEHLNMESGIVRVLRFGIPAKYGGGIKKNLIPLMKFQISLYRWLKKTEMIMALYMHVTLTRPLFHLK